MNTKQRGAMTNTEMQAELLERAARLEEAASRCRQAAAILVEPEATNGNGKHGVIELTATNGHRGAPPRKRDRAVRAITKHGPMSVSVLGAYISVPTKDVPGYAARWIASGHLALDQRTGRYALGPVGGGVLVRK